VRLLWSLPKAAPAILRHLVGYAELAAGDLEQTQRDLQARLIAGLIVLIAIFFVILTVFVAVVALTWDTPHRVAALGWMGIAFLMVAVAAVLYRARVLSAQAPFLGSVRREWAEDRIILERILSEND
jgi:uncharacterized membrane protein YqjE